MKKQVLTAVALLSLLVTLVMSGYANSGRIKVDIPFAFTAGKVTLPAGKYVIEQSRAIHNVLLILDAEGKSKTFLTTMTAENSQRAESKAQLVFNRYGETYFLSQIREPGSTRVHELTKTAAERELLKKWRNHFAGNVTAPEIVAVRAQ